MALPKKRPEESLGDFEFLNRGDSDDVTKQVLDQSADGSAIHEGLLGAKTMEMTSVDDELAQCTAIAQFSGVDVVNPERIIKSNSSQHLPLGEGRKGNEPAQQSTSATIAGYAIAVTLLLLFCLATGRLSLTGNHALESLPDIRPLSPNEFRKVPDGTEVPPKHVMKLGESRRFGDVLVTPVRVTRESLLFQHFQSGVVEGSLTTIPVLKLWVKFENVSTTYGFPPFDAGLISKRTPEHSSDEATIANSYLTVKNPPAWESVRVLNYLQSMDDNFVITGQDSARVIMPKESLDTFIACSEEIAASGTAIESLYVWRVQFRKGVHEGSGNGITTLIDVNFTGSDVVEQSSTAPPVPG